MSRWIGILSGLLLGVFSLACSVPAAENEMVPPGAWVLRTAYSQETLDSAIAADNTQHTLKYYLIPDRETLDLIDGEIERSEQSLEVLLGLGLTEAWTLHMETAYRTIEQTSKLSTTSSNAAALAEVDRLNSGTVSGLGQLTLKALYRPLYTDRSSFLWGFGFSIPGSGTDTPYAGRGTLYLGTPFTELFGLLHSTTYFFPARVRFDVNVLVGDAITRDLEQTDGTRLSVHPGRFGHLYSGVEHDLGPVFYGIGISADLRGDARISGAKQGDSYQNYGYRVMLGSGNLDQLEQEPIAFPYQFHLQLDQTIQGYNTPLHTTARVFFKTYF